MPEVKHTTQYSILADSHRSLLPPSPKFRKGVAGWSKERIEICQLADLHLTDLGHHRPRLCIHVESHCCKQQPSPKNNDKFRAQINSARTSTTVPINSDKFPAQISFTETFQLCQLWPPPVTVAKPLTNRRPNDRGNYCQLNLLGKQSSEPTKVLLHHRRRWACRATLQLSMSALYSCPCFTVKS